MESPRILIIHSNRSSVLCINYTFLVNIKTYLLTLTLKNFHDKVNVVFSLFINLHACRFLHLLYTRIFMFYDYLLWLLLNFLTFLYNIRT